MVDNKSKDDITTTIRSTELDNLYNRVKETKILRKMLDQMATKPNLAFAIPKLIPLGAVGLALGSTIFSGIADGTIVGVVPTKAIFCFEHAFMRLYQG